MPALIVAPGAPAAGPDPEADADEPADGLDELPQAETIAPSTGMDKPMTLPRRMKSRREMRPAAYSSMTWLAISPCPLRRLLSRSSFTGAFS
jgi:hypothetical protein